MSGIKVRMRLTCSGLLCVLVVLVTPVTVFASDYYKPIGEQVASAEIEQLFDAAFLLDISTSSVLYAKDAERVISPIGGAVSLMAAYVVINEADWELEIPITDIIQTISSGVRRMDLQVGRRWPVKDLVAGMLLPGAQDAALVLSDHVSGSQEAFVTLMNQYAHDLGMSNTQYMNPLGAYAAEQTTTISDLILLSMAVLENDVLRELLAKSQYHALSGDTIINRMEVMQEGNSNYDSRIKGLGEGSTAASGTNTIIYVVDGERTCLFAGYTAEDNQAGSEQNAIKLIDFFLDAYIPFDVAPLIADLLDGRQIDIDDGTFVTPAMEDGSFLLAVEKGAIDSDISAGFTISELPALNTVPIIGEGIGSVTLRHDDQPIRDIPIIAQDVHLPATELLTDDEPINNDEMVIPVYSAEDWEGSKKEKTFIGKYGGSIVIGTTILLAGAVLLIARYFTGKKHSKSFRRTP